MEGLPASRLGSGRRCIGEGVASSTKDLAGRSTMRASRSIRALQSELGALQKLLAETPADHVIRSDEPRIPQARRRGRARVRSPRQPGSWSAPTSPTFRGRPVVGSHGVFAKFLAPPRSEPSPRPSPPSEQARASPWAPWARSPDATTTGSSSRARRRARSASSWGRRPSRTSRSSPRNPPSTPAIAQTKAILQATLGTDDELSEALSETGPRARTRFASSWR